MNLERNYARYQNASSWSRKDNSTLDTKNISKFQIHHYGQTKLVTRFLVCWVQIWPLFWAWYARHTLTCCSFRQFSVKCNVFRQNWAIKYNRNTSFSLWSSYCLGLRVALTLSGNSWGVYIISRWCGWRLGRPLCEAAHSSVVVTCQAEVPVSACTASLTLPSLRLASGSCKVSTDLWLK